MYLVDDVHFLRPTSEQYSPEGSDSDIVTLLCCSIQFEDVQAMPIINVLSGCTGATRLHVLAQVPQLMVRAKMRAHVVLPRHAEQ